MSRDHRLYLEDMLACAHKVMQYTAGMDRTAFVADSRSYDAVIRNLEIIGEAAKHVPQEIRSAYTSIGWRPIAGFRDVLAHGYFSLDNDVVWDVISNHIPRLIAELPRILSDTKQQP